MSYFDTSMDMPERLGKTAGDTMAALIVLSVVLLVLSNML